MGHPTDSNGSIDLGVGSAIHLMQRAKLDIPEINYANIKGLVSAIDRLADTSHTSEELRSMLGEKRDDTSLIRLREELVGDVGLLGIYPISKDSKPQQPEKQDGKRRRIPLDAVEHVMGIGIFFPKNRTNDGYTYYSADLSSLRREQADLEAELEAADAADEASGEAADQQAVK
jgi:hypothetical protein